MAPRHNLVNKARQALSFLETLDKEESEEAERLLRELEALIQKLKIEWAV